MRSAPAGSSVNAHGLTIAYGSPLSRTKSSPYSNFTIRSFVNKRIWEKRRAVLLFSWMAKRIKKDRDNSENHYMF